ncbi:hypothetical protein DFP72DRAFT_846428 [Ephemerocybe angulata]|uniref:Uncharacterized protein n=1 Tax=Ephemerocybe angulata TaxID=980116 RepID=A0A8H6I256_9AGAR|nr:hypothetical protein DFP72DRAFT_846428 [Tulosesus angulatus]
MLQLQDLHPILIPILIHFLILVQPFISVLYEAVFGKSFISVLGVESSILKAFEERNTVCGSLHAKVWGERVVKLSTKLVSRHIQWNAVDTVFATLLLEAVTRIVFETSQPGTAHTPPGMMLTSAPHDTTTVWDPETEEKKYIKGPMHLMGTLALIHQWINA